MEVVQVTVTFPGKEQAAQVGRQMVAQRLAACAQLVGPINSIYWWQGAIEEAEEWLCIFKTTRGRFPALAEALRAAHPYDVPEILAVPVIEGHAAYLEWVNEETQAE